MTPDDSSSFPALVMDHYQDPYHCGAMEYATHAAEAANPVCEDSVRIELRLDRDGRIEEAWYQAKGCVLCQASASILCEAVEGMSVVEAREFSANEMLKKLDEPIAVNRNRCCLLSWRVLQTALQTPIDEDAEDDCSFGGPSLSEEC